MTEDGKLSSSEKIKSATKKSNRKKRQPESNHDELNHISNAVAVAVGAADTDSNSGTRKSRRRRKTMNIGTKRTTTSDDAQQHENSTGSFLPPLGKIGKITSFDFKDSDVKNKIKSEKLVRDYDPALSSKPKRRLATAEEEEEEEEEGVTEDCEKLETTPTTSSCSANSRATRQLLRKLSSFTMNKTAEDLAAGTARQDDDDDGALPSSSGSAKEAPSSKTRQLLRKLSSFTSSDKKNEEKTKPAAVEDSRTLHNTEVNCDKKPNEGKVMSFKSSIMSSLRRNCFIGNPTASFQEEQKKEQEKQEEEFRPRKKSIKMSLVTYFQKNIVTNEMQATTEPEHPEEAVIRQILREQEEAEERETLRRLVQENCFSKDILSAAEGRKTQEVVATALTKTKRVHSKNITTSNNSTLEDPSSRRKVEDSGRS